MHEILDTHSAPVVRVDRTQRIILDSRAPLLLFLPVYSVPPSHFTEGTHKALPGVRLGNNRQGAILPLRCEYP